MQNNNLKQRLISAFIIGLVLLLGIFFYRPFFSFLLTIIALGIFWEWYKMTRSSIPDMLVGLVVLPVPVISILTISELDSKGWFLFTFILVISAVDTFAMIGGKFFKGPKLAKNISPKKTISGLLCGSIFAGFVPGIINFITDIDFSYILSNNITLYNLSLFSMGLGFIAQGSDLFVSIFKRKFNIKDTGSIIPGHGGVLDRFDSYIFTAPLVLFFLNSNLN